LGGFAGGHAVGFGLASGLFVGGLLPSFLGGRHLRGLLVGGLLLLGRFLVARGLGGGGVVGGLLRRGLGGHAVGLGLLRGLVVGGLLGGGFVFRLLARGLFLGGLGGGGLVVRLLLGGGLLGGLLRGGLLGGLAADALEVEGEGLLLGRRAAALDDGVVVRVDEREAVLAREVALVGELELPRRRRGETRRGFLKQGCADERVAVAVELEREALERALGIAL